MGGARVCWLGLLALMGCGRFGFDAGDPSDDGHVNDGNRDSARDGTGDVAANVVAVGMTTTT